MHYGIVMFSTDYAIRPDELARAVEEPRLRVALVPGAHPHPGQPPQPVAGRRRPAARVLAHLRPVRGAGDGGGRHDRRSSSAPASAWSSSATRSRWRRRSRPRPPLGRALPLRHRRRLERARRWRTTAPTSRRAGGVLRERILAMKEIWTQDEAEYHGEFVNFDKIWSWPEAGPEAAPADPHGRRRPDDVRPRRASTATAGCPIAGRMGPALFDKIATLQRRRQGNGPRTQSP